MNIWVSKLRGRPVECKSCNQFMYAGEPVIRGRIYKDQKSYNFFWHVKNRDGYCCWLEDGLLELEKKPHVETRGRKRKIADEATREKRLVLLKKRGSLLQRLRRATAVHPQDRDIDLIITLGAQLEQVKIDIMPLGGIPDGW